MLVVVAPLLRFAAPAVWSLVGLVAYATAVSATWLGDPVDRWLGFAVMVVSLMGTLAVAVAIHSDETPAT